MLVIAHRGASAVERENTLAAFERAIALGADFVELDVQAASDGELVVFHDLTLDRLTPLSGPVRRRPSAELREIGIPTVLEALELMRGRIGVMAEIKGAWRSPQHAVSRRTAELLGEDDVLLSFDARSLLDARRARPRLRLLQHVGYGVSIRRAAGYSCAVGFSDRRLTPRGLAKARRLGLATTVYTVNDVERMRELALHGVDGIFSDRPDLLRAAVNRL